MYDLPLYVISYGTSPLVAPRPKPRPVYWLLKLLMLLHASVHSFALVYALSFLSNAAARLVCVVAVNFAVNCSLVPVLKGIGDYITRIFRQPVADGLDGWALEWPAFFSPTRKRERTWPEFFPRTHKRKRT
jgi:hypothetical protein